MYADINRSAQQRYLAGLTALVAAAVPTIGAAEAARRAGEILVVQNGIWLTAAIIDDPSSLARANARCEQIAFETRSIP